MQFSKVVQVNSMDELAKIQDKSLVRSQAYVDGQWVDAKSGKTFKVQDPATLQTIGNVSDMDATDVQQAIDAASHAFASWKTTTAKQRSVLLRKWHELIIANNRDLARLMTLEGGKPLAEAAGEVTYGASFIEWFGEEAKRAYGDVVPSPMANTRMVVMKQPVGVVGIITPYNFPN
ncbi:hypothetical protein GGF40_002346, partial [Coemansia sp. RSA 1286]